MKRCPRCNINLPHSAFNKCAGQKDGLQSYCRDCNKKYQCGYYVDHIDDVKQRVAEYKCDNLQKVQKQYREASSRWKHNNPTYSYYEKNKVAEQNKGAIYRQQNKYKIRARHAVQYAVRMGILVKSDCCEICGALNSLEGHHKSYDKDYWLDVLWVCRSCHQRLHGGGI